MVIEVKHIVPVKAPKEDTKEGDGLPCLWIAFVGDHIRCWVSDKTTAEKYAKERGLMFYEFKATGEWLI